MNIQNEWLDWNHLPYFLPEAEQLHRYLKSLSKKELQSLWKCSDKLSQQNYFRLHSTDLEKNLTPAVFSYEGLQYQYMAPQVMTEAQLTYLEEHLRILSGFYGVLRPFDGVVPYRLEMQAHLSSFSCSTLYQFWGDKLFRFLQKDSKIILNLASKEYSKAILPYCGRDTKIVTCFFGEKTASGLREKGTYAKMARGEMVRYLASVQGEDLAAVKKFDGLRYHFCERLSTSQHYVFIKENE